MCNAKMDEVSSPLEGDVTAMTVIDQLGCVHCELGCVHGELGCVHGELGCVHGVAIAHNGSPEHSSTCHAIFAGA